MIKYFRTCIFISIITLSNCQQKVVEQIDKSNISISKEAIDNNKNTQNQNTDTKKSTDDGLAYLKMYGNTADKVADNTKVKNNDKKIDSNAKDEQIKPEDKDKKTDTIDSNSIKTKDLGLDYLKAYNRHADSKSANDQSNTQKDKEDKTKPAEVTDNATPEDGLFYLKALNNKELKKNDDKKSDINNAIIDTTTQESNYCVEVYDPYEKFNRVIYNFNSTIDYFLLRPISILYDKVTNNYVKARVGSFFDNITTPISTVNHMLQFNYNNTMHSFWRFIINTTVGVGGLFDVATKVGLPQNHQGFGDTLAHYGVAPGPYIVLPLFGGTTVRSLLDQIVTVENLVPTASISRAALMCHNSCKMVHYRAKMLPYTDHVMQNSLDSYVNIRSTIFQNKESSVKYPKKFICPTVKK